MADGFRADDGLRPPAVMTYDFLYNLTITNRALAEAGLLTTRTLKGRQYADLPSSRAFAVVDHEVAHISVRDAADMEAAADILRNTDGIETVLDGAAQRDCGIAHRRAGDLVAVAADDCWLAYPWWQQDCEAPDYASHVDIHNKPGFDPCELFLGWPPGSISRNPARVKGSHGRTGPGREAAWACAGIEIEANSLADLGNAVMGWLGGNAEVGTRSAERGTGKWE